MAQEKLLYGVGLNACSHGSTQCSAAEIQEKSPNGRLQMIAGGRSMWLWIDRPAPQNR